MELENLENNDSAVNTLIKRVAALKYESMSTDELKHAVRELIDEHNKT